MKNISRREFIGKSAATLAATSVLGSAIGAPSILHFYGKPNSKFAGVQIGAITYSFRSMPMDAASIIKYCTDAGVSAIEMMGWTGEGFCGAPGVSTDPLKPYVPGQRHEPTPEEIAERKARQDALAKWRSTASMDKYEQLHKMFKDAGIDIYAFKPDALGVDNTDAEVHYAMKAARALGCTHVTVEMPQDPAQTQRLASIAGQYKMYVAYHGHLQQTPTLWDTALAQSPWNMMNCDLGHYTAAGYDAVALIKAKHDRIASAHLKDRKNKEDGGDNMPWGQGDTPLPQILTTMRDNKFKFPGTIELEYDIPDGSDAVKEVAKCVEFCKNILVA